MQWLLDFLWGKLLVGKILCDDGVIVSQNTHTCFQNHVPFLTGPLNLLYLAIVILHRERDFDNGFHYVGRRVATRLG